MAWKYGSQKKEAPEVEETKPIDDYETLVDAFNDMQLRNRAWIDKTTTNLTPLAEDIGGDGKEKPGLLHDVDKMLSRFARMKTSSLGVHVQELMKKITDFLDWYNYYEEEYEDFIRGYIHYCKSAFNIIDKLNEEIDKLHVEIDKLQERIKEVKEEEKEDVETEEKTEKRQEEVKKPKTFRSLLPEEKKIFTIQAYEMFDKYADALLKGDGRLAGSRKGTLFTMPQGHPEKIDIVKRVYYEEYEKLRQYLNKQQFGNKNLPENGQNQPVSDSQQPQNPLDSERTTESLNNDENEQEEETAKKKFQPEEYIIKDKPKDSGDYGENG